MRIALFSVEKMGACFLEKNIRRMMQGFWGQLQDFVLISMNQKSMQCFFVHYVSRFNPEFQFHFPRKESHSMEFLI